MDPVAEYYAVRQDLIALARAAGLDLHTRGLPMLWHTIWIIKQNGEITHQFEPENLDNLIDLLESRIRAN